MNTPEQTQPRPYNLESLQGERYDRAVAASEHQLRAAFAGDRAENPNVSFTKIENTAFSYDRRILPADELLAIDALGIDLYAFAAKTGRNSGKEEEVIETIRLQDEAMTIKRYDEGMTLRFEKDGHEPDFNHPVASEAMKQKIAARFAASPAHQAMAAANQQLQGLDTLPRTVSTEPFDGMADPLGTAAFTDQIGLTSGGGKLATKLRSGSTVAEAVASSLDDSLWHGTVVHEDEAARTFTWGKGAVRQLTIDKATGNYTYSASMDPASNYLETPDQAPSVEAIPFVETECARELSGLLDSAGLTFHPDIQERIVSMEDSGRFGSVYTEMSREVAKWVNRTQRTQLSELFVPYTPTPATEIPIDQSDEEATRERWASVDHTVQGEAAGVLVGMIDNVLARGDEQPQPSDIPVTGQEVKIRDGACFDVTGYYIGAAAENKRDHKLQATTEGSTKMLAKTYGKPTLMLTAPALFNGIPLPKGSLLSKQADGYAFLRLTSFTFDNQADQLAFDPELAKPRSYRDKEIKAIGGVTLAHLMKQV